MKGLHSIALITVLSGNVSEPSVSTDMGDVDTGLTGSAANRLSCMLFIIVSTFVYDCSNLTLVF